MKNIHLIPTSQPSKLKQNKITKKLSLVNKGIDLTAYTPINIYITSDEEIKPNIYCFINGVLCKTELLEDKIVSRQLAGGATMDICKSEYSEIILTTDQDLIKDGVQAIDDEFLEWFVKNPSCEEVNVVKEKQHIGEEVDESYPKGFFDYKIIIPKEELLNCSKCRTTDFKSCHSISCPMRKKPKQETGKEFYEFSKEFYESADKVITVKRQETLEKVAHKMLDDYGIKSIGQSIGVLEVKKLMVKMAKWQAEKMFSKEEVIAIVEKSRATGLTAEYLIKQFKNKQHEKEN